MDILVLLSIFSKFALYFGILFAVGTAFYTILFETEEAKSSFSARTMILIFVAIGMIASLAGFGIQAARLTGEAASMLDPEMLGILWETSVGTVLVMRIIGLALLLICLFIGAFGKPVGIIGSVFALASFTQIGHISNISFIMPQVILLLHLVGIALWIGILFPLFKLSANNDLIAATGRIAHRFGNLASGFVPILLVAGGWLTFELVSSVQNLLFTGYGQMLLAKIALVVGLLGLAAANKLRFVPSLVSGDITALNHIRKSVRFEIILVVLVLIFTAVLTSVLTVPEVQS